MKLSLSKFTYIVLFVAMWPLFAWSGSEKRNFTLVIDAGHGGHDAGAVGAFSKEKDINLRVALAFGRLVEENCNDVKVIYTRKTDVFIPLQTRANIANNAKADLFISVHTNALPNGRIAYGSETYTLGMARASANLAVAKRENSVITLESDYKQTYQGFDPNKAESYVIFEFMQDRFMKQSVDLASSIQKQYTSAGRPNKGVHQAGFLVLRNTSMPSVLTELGFITTPAEEKYLNSQEGTTELSRSIYNGFLAYRRMHDRSANNIPANLPTQQATHNVAQAETNETQSNQCEEANDEVKAEPKEVAVVPVAAVPTARLIAATPIDDEPIVSQQSATRSAEKATVSQPSEKPVVTVKKAEAMPKKAEATPKKAESAPKKVESTPKKAEPIAKKKETTTKKADTTPKKTEATPKKGDTKPKEAAKNGEKKKADTKKTGSTTAQSSTKNNPKTNNKDKEKNTERKQKVTYRIQVGAGKVEISPTDAQFKGLNVTRVKEGTMYKYFYGTYSTYAEAQKSLRTVKQKMPNAYIAAYVAGKCVTVAEARAKE